MSWLVFAFSGPVLWAASTHIDKYLVEKYFKKSNVAVLLIFTALIGMLMLPFIAILVPEAVSVAPSSALLMALSGILYMGAMLFYLWALQSEDAASVAPFYQAAPLFGYVLAYLVLGEELSAVQMVGGSLIIVGTLLVSLQSQAQKTAFKIHLAALMLTCALVLAASSLIFKLFALRAEFWPTTFWMYAGETVFGVVLFVIPSVRKQFIKLLQFSPGAVLSVNAANELINLGGSLGTRYALLLAPLSLVQAIGSTTTIFVFAFGIVLSIIFPTANSAELTREDLMRKGIAAIIVALGSVLVCH